MDTIGRSPRDLAKLAEMKEILAICGSQATVYLALAATTKASDTEEILRQFEPFGYRAVILTKLDETMRIGNIISCLARHRKPVAYLCDGQGVPQDLEEATVVRLLMNMEGFRIDREALEKRFGRKARGGRGDRRQLIVVERGILRDRRTRERRRRRPQERRRSRAWKGSLRHGRPGGKAQGARGERRVPRGRRLAPPRVGSKEHRGGPARARAGRRRGSSPSPAARAASARPTSPSTSPSPTRRRARRSSSWTPTSAWRTSTSCSGVIPRYNLYHLIRKQKTLSEILVDTSYGIQIIAGASGFSKIANLTEEERRDFIAELAALSNADVLIIDCAAGVSNNVISFIAAADDALIVTTPEPTAITDAYGIIKIIATEIENLDLGLKLVVNRVKSVVEGKKVAERVINIAGQFLNLKVDYLGFVYDDPGRAHLRGAAEAVPRAGPEVPRRRSASATSSAGWRTSTTGTGRGSRCS